MTQKKHIVIAGGGFAGVKLALELSDASELYDITLISNKPAFEFYPTLYHTAVGGTSAQSSLPLAELFAGKPVTVVLAEVSKVDRDRKQLHTTKREKFSYDILVLALGTITNYFGIPGMAEYAYTLKSVADAKRLKAHLHEQIDERGKPALNYVVVGGGPTGIELAGMLPAYLKEVAKAHGVSPKGIHVDLVEAMPTLVPRLPKRIGRQIAKRLRRLGVSLYLGKKVEGASPAGLTVDGKPIQSHSIIWTAGVANHPFFTENKFTLTDRRKVQVDKYLQAERSIFVIGDNADTPYSGMAQTALYDAIFLARNLIREAEGDAMEPYTPKPPITVIPVGTGWAAVQWGKVQLFGFVGWMLRLAADAKGFADYAP